MCKAALALTMQISCLIDAKTRKKTRRGFHAKATSAPRASRLHLQIHSVHRIGFMQGSLLCHVGLTLFFHCPLHLLLLLVSLLLVLVLLRCELVLDLALFILQYRLVGLRLEQRLLLVRRLLEAHQLVVRLLIHAHFLGLQFLIHLHVELNSVLLSGLTERLLLHLVVLLKHARALLQLLVQALRVGLLLCINASRVGNVFCEFVGWNGPSTESKPSKSTVLSTQAWHTHHSCLVGLTGGCCKLEGRWRRRLLREASRLLLIGNLVGWNAL
mmetsp:Transcript_23340/g.51297  ORF Transcript_23340/g.51297 Transcript_23340/m.51297 type:complete len:271 (+) Transcript_23340:143-955(+)